MFVKVTSIHTSLRDISKNMIQFAVTDVFTSQQNSLVKESELKTFRPLQSSIQLIKKTGFDNEDKSNITAVLRSITIPRDWLKR